MKFTQIEINGLHLILSQTGYCNGFGDIYAAGKLMADLPKSVLAASADKVDMKAMSKEFEVTLDQRGKEIIGKAIRAYQGPSAELFGIMLKLDIKPD